MVVKEKIATDSANVLRLDKDYLHFLNDLKGRLHQAQMKAALAVNLEQLKFYWETGKTIAKLQKTKSWGSKFLQQLSHDLKAALPEMSGFSRRNLELMSQFSQTYPDFEFAKQPVSQLPWGHNILLMQKIKNPKQRNWYASEAVSNGWSRAILQIQIESGLFERQALPDQKVSNFQSSLPPLQSDLAQSIFKDPYKFDFLTIEGKAHEREVEQGLIAHIRDFLLELGQGFSFVGSQVPLTFDDQEYFVDLLFYHLRLRCYVVIELKATSFKPEHTGQLGFYLAAVDDQLRHAEDRQSIGMLLCKTKNKVVAEYALKNIKAPIGISEYEISKALPKEMALNLPTIEEIESELQRCEATE